MAQVSTTTGAFQELSLQFTADREGYILVYTANQTAEDLDVFIDDLLVEHIESPVIRTDDYYPFGLAFNSSQRTGVLTNKYLYNGKELQTDLDLDWYDYGARMYDVAIGRWSVVDPLAERRIDYTPYSYVLNNPILRIDPEGLTDFTFNKETGEVAQVGEANDDPDRIVITYKGGKNKGEVKTYKRGKRKGENKTESEFTNIPKGILEDRQNFRRDDVVVDVNGEGQPTTAQVQDFIVKISEHVGVEITGVYLSNEDADNADISKIYIDEYAGNTKKGSYLTPTRLTEDGLKDMNINTHFHTHPSAGYAESDRYRASDEDKGTRDMHRDLIRRFIILTKAPGYPTRANKPKDYTND